MLSNGMTSLSLASFSSRNEPAMRSFWSRTPSNQLPPSAYSNIGRRISVVGQNRTFGDVRQMSALPPKSRHSFPRPACRWDYRAVTDGPVVGSLRQSCLAQALNEADAVLRPSERRRYPVKIAEPQRRIDLAQAGHCRPRFDHPTRKSIGYRRHPQCRGPVRLLMDGLGRPGYRPVVTTG